MADNLCIWSSATPPETLVNLMCSHDEHPPSIWCPATSSIITKCGFSMAWLPTSDLYLFVASHCTCYDATVISVVRKQLGLDRMLNCRFLRRGSTIVCSCAKLHVRFSWCSTEPRTSVRAFL